MPYIFLPITLQIYHIFCTTPNIDCAFSCLLRNDYLRERQTFQNLIHTFAALKQLLWLNKNILLRHGNYNPGTV